MSGHADTPMPEYLKERDALVAENRQQAETIATLADAIERWKQTVERQADRIAWLEGEVAGWRIKLAECEERHERRALREQRDEEEAAEVYEL